MRHITDDEYLDIAEYLTERIDGSTYWKGEINGADWTLIGAVMISWNTDLLGSGEVETRMSRLKWITYMFITYDELGNRTLNDFNTDKLNEFLGI